MGGQCRLHCSLFVGTRDAFLVHRYFVWSGFKVHSFRRIVANGATKGLGRSAHQLELLVPEGQRVKRRLLHNARLQQVCATVLKRERHRFHTLGVQPVLGELAYL